MKNNLILASASPRREELLKQLGLNFTIVPSKVNEEEYSNLPPKKMVTELSRAKAEEVAQLVEDTIVIAADTIVVYEDKIMGKPANSDDAYQMLRTLSNTQHQVLSGVAVLSSEGSNQLIDYDITEVYMRELSDKEINSYINSGEPMGKAGSYAIQGLGGVFIEKISGSYFTVMGLPIHILNEMLGQFDINIF